MSVFAQYEAACRYVWEQPGHARSHISTRIIPAAHGQFDNYRLYADQAQSHQVCISPLMALYWFFDASAVVRSSLIIDTLRATHTRHQAMMNVAARCRLLPARPRRTLPYPSGQTHQNQYCRPSPPDPLSPTPLTGLGGEGQQRRAPISNFDAIALPYP